jgi:hypothetical protein
MSRGHTGNGSEDAGDGVASSQERLCRARNMVARQAAIVRFLQRNGQPTETAIAVLASFENALGELEAARSCLSGAQYAAGRQPAIIVFGMSRQPSSAPPLGK